MEKQTGEIPRPASSEKEAVPAGAISIEIDGVRAFISARDKHQPLVGNRPFDRVQLRQIDQLTAMIHSGDREDNALNVSDEVRRDLERKAKSLFRNTNNRANPALRNLVRNS